MAIDKENSNRKAAQRARQEIAQMPPAEMGALVHELETQQTELGIQNEELRKTQLQLADMRDRYLDLYEYAPVGYLTLDAHGTVLTANLTAATLLGVEPRNLIGDKFAAYVDAVSQDTLQMHYRAVFVQPVKHTCDLKMRRVRGRALYVQMESSVIEQGGKIVSCRTTMTEITELQETHHQLQRINQSLEALAATRTRQMEAINAQLREEVARHRASAEALAHEQDFNRTLIDTARTIILVLDKEGRVVSFNPYMEELSGYRLDEVRGKSWFDVFLPASDRERIRAVFERSAAGARTRGNTNSIVTRGGRELVIEWYDAEVTGPDGEFAGLLCTGQDVTERKTLQEQLLTIAETEQKRIGEHLHDDLGQELVALRLNMDTLVDALRADDSPELEKAQKIAAGMLRAVRKVRELSRGLVMLTVNQENFFDELGGLCRQLSEFEEVHCSCSCQPVVIPSDQVANQLYHIAKEAMTNSLKHGGVEGLWVEVDLKSIAGNTVLTVRDNGHGVPEDAEQMSGSGLRIMQNRAELIRASLSIRRHPEGGTLVTCIVPQGRGKLADYPPLSSL